MLCFPQDFYFSISCCLTSPKLYEAWGCFGWLFNGQKLLHLLWNIWRYIMRRSVLAHSGTQVGQQLTTCLKLPKFPFVLFPYIVWILAVKCWGWRGVSKIRCAVKIMKETRTLMAPFRWKARCSIADLFTPRKGNFGLSFPTSVMALMTDNATFCEKRLNSV